jgi:uncharacterized protein
MINPFKYGRIVSDEDFCSRPVLQKELARCITSSQNVLVEGERRTGKTSLIFETIRRLDKYHYLYIDCFEIKSVDDLFRRIVNALLHDENHGSFLTNILKTLSHLRPVISVDPITGGPSVSINATTDAKPDSLDSVMDMIGSTFKKQKTVIVFDEFQDILQLKESRRVLALLRGKIQFQTSISYVFAGSVRNTMHDIFYDPSSPFFKSATSITVGGIPQKRFSEFISAKFFHNGRRKISPEVLETVFSITQEVPGDVQEFCAAIWDCSPANRSVAKTLVPVALELIYSREHRIYENHLSMITGQQLRCLVSLARRGGKNPYSIDFINDSGIRQPGSIRKAITRLTDLKIIYLFNREYKFVNPFFRSWLLAKGY